MATDIMPQTPAVITLPGGLPALIENAGERTAWRFVEFFIATIRNANTRGLRPGGGALPGLVRGQGDL
jgi:hypothetical protein